MTRARTASYGVVTPPPLDRWIEVVLMLCVSLVQGVRATLGMILNRNRRDWHTETADEDLPQATSGNQSQEPNHNHGVMLGPVPSISVGPARGLSIDPLEAINRDARHEAERDSVDVAAIAATYSLSFRTHAQRASRNPWAMHVQRHTLPLGSRSRVYPEPVEGRVGNDTVVVLTSVRA